MVLGIKVVSRVDILSNQYLDKETLVLRVGTRAFSARPAPRSKTFSPEAFWIFPEYFILFILFKISLFVRQFSTTSVKQSVLYHVFCLLGGDSASKIFYVGSHKQRHEFYKIISYTIFFWNMKFSELLERFFIKLLLQIFQRPIFD